MGLRGILTVGFSALVLVGGYVWRENRTNGLMQNLYQAHMQAQASTTAFVTSLEHSFEIRLTALEERNAALSEMLYDVQKQFTHLDNRMQAFGSEVRDLTGSVEGLSKLATTDPELLQKYSKIYFLNENYLPADLTPVSELYDHKNGKQALILTQVKPFLEELLKDADRAGTPARVLSAYRSFAEQEMLKGLYTVRYGSGANQFSADQGYSEHQLGTAVDFTTDVLGDDLTGFVDTRAYQWLLGNAYKYGFVLSYPQGNAYYMFEPWHWRFVGKDLAKHLHEEGKAFYDLDQRVLDAYLGTLWDD